MTPYAAEAEVVREIIRLDKGGVPVREIVNALNRRAARRRNGEPWTGRQVRAILSRRELYERGKVHYGTVEGQDKRLILMTITDV